MKNTWLALSFVVVGLVPGLRAQRLDPVHWTLVSDTTKAPPGSAFALRLTAKLDEGWHLYSPTTPKGPVDNPGPNATKLGLAENPAFSPEKIYQPKPDRKFDPNFNLDTETFEKEVTFILVPSLKSDAGAGPVEVIGKVRYQTCSSTTCLPPKNKEAVFTLTVDPTAPVPPAFALPAGYSEVTLGVPAVVSSAAPSTSSGSPNLAAFVLTAFGLGLAAIFTPCVFPMIPITMSFFLNQRGGILQAVVFCLGIIVFFCLLGVGVTAAVGPFGVNQLGSNPWVNGFIALVFGAFALSLLGAFEITLPSGLLTKLDSASRRGGYFGTLLMGLTFSLTSFACIGPFMGSLLVASAQSKGAQPLLGMMGFSAGLASPFFFLAAFPSYLKKLPRSGGWLARVKVVMGFALLALMLKYASNIDQVLQLNWLTRERFLAGWAVLAVMAGLYLLGLLRMEGVEPDEQLGIPRLLIACLLLIFGLSLVPGMFGVPLGNIDAFVPAGNGLALGGSPSAVAGPPWLKNQYRAALDRAKQENKRVLVVFTGYACTNCHWMKANMFPRPEVAAATKDMILVELYTDGNDSTVEEYQKLEDEKFKTAAQPLYAILDPNENPLATFEGSTPDVSKFLEFLNKGSAPAS